MHPSMKCGAAQGCWIAVAVSAVMCGQAVAAPADNPAVAAVSGSAVHDGPKSALNLTDASKFDDGMYHWEPSSQPSEVGTTTMSLTISTSTTSTTIIMPILTDAAAYDDENDKAVSFYDDETEILTQDVNDDYGEAAIRSQWELPLTTIPENCRGDLLPGILCSASKGTEMTATQPASTSQAAEKRGITYTYTVTAASVKRTTSGNGKAKSEVGSSADDTMAQDAEETATADESAKLTAMVAKKKVNNKKMPMVKTVGSYAGESTIDKATSKGGKRLQNKRPEKTSGSFTTAMSETSAGVSSGSSIFVTNPSASTVWWTPASSFNDGQWTPRSAIPAKRTHIADERAGLAEHRRPNNAARAKEASGVALEIALLALLLYSAAETVMG